MTDNSVKLILVKNIPIIYYLLSFVLHPIRRTKKILENIHYRHNLKKVSIFQEEALAQLYGKACLSCVFIVTHYQSWKYDCIYKKMETNKRFLPLILICPTINYGKEKMLSHMADGVLYFKNKGYNVLNAYDEILHKYIDLEKDINPDIIFFDNPYKGLIDNRYYIDKFLKHLTIYVSYNFGNNNDYQMFNNLPLHNLVWRFYAETEEHKSYSLLYSRNKGKNVVVSGYPGIEPFLDSRYNPICKDWKMKDPNIKKIIWAPHHTISPVKNVDYSCFIRYSYFMLSIADKYKDKVQFVFKPHPLLKDRLDLLWGKKKADSYYEQWKSKSNCNISNGDYIDLFYSSDAMIHDCGSFIIEYLYMNKPVMRTLNNIPLENMFNPFALRCLDQYYFAQEEHDIEQFILNVINNIDPLKDQRSRFVNEKLIPIGSPSQNIVDDILESIDKHILYR